MDYLTEAGSMKTPEQKMRDLSEEIANFIQSKMNDLEIELRTQLYIDLDYNMTETNKKEYFVVIED